MPPQPVSHTSVSHAPASVVSEAGIEHLFKSSKRNHQWPNADWPAAHKIDITIVVDMLLTGFDSKNLNLHGLITSGLSAYEQ